MNELRELAVIRTGYPFREKPERVLAGGCPLVQMKDLNPKSPFRVYDLERVFKPDDYQRHALQPGDVLMAARGKRNNAATFPGASESVIPASHILVLRPNASVLPEYLSWFLNLPSTQEALGERRAGSSIPFVSVQALGGLRVPVPNKEKQKQIVELHKLALREQELLAEIKTKRWQLMNAQLREVLQRDPLAALPEPERHVTLDEILREIESENENS